MMIKNHNNIVTKSKLTLNTDQNGEKISVSPLQFLSSKDIFSLSTSSLAIGEVQKHDPVFKLNPLSLENNNLNLTEGHPTGEKTLDQMFSWHKIAMTDNVITSDVTPTQVNAQKDSIAFGDSTYESLIPIKPFQSNDFDKYQSDYQPGKIENNALDIANFEPPASDKVEIFYAAATDAEFAQAAGTKTQLELPSEFDYTTVASDALPALTPAIHDGRLIQEHPQANPDINSYTEGTPINPTGNVLINDIANGNILTVSNPGTYQGIYGTLTLNTDGSYTYIHKDPAIHAETQSALNASGDHNDVFTYGLDNGNTSTLTIKIIPVESTPVTPVTTPVIQPHANPDTNSYTEGSGTPLTGNVLTNDNTNDGGTLTVATAGNYAGTYGDLTLNQDGTYTYAPHDPSTDPGTSQALNTSGPHQDVFNYTDTNASGATTSSTLTVTIATNPQANPDTNSYIEGSGTPVAGNVLTNDNANGGVLHVEVPQTYYDTYGTITLNADGSYTDIPNSLSANPSIVDALNAQGSVSDVVPYTAINADGVETSSNLTITYTANPPVPEPNSYTFGTDAASDYVNSPGENGNYEFYFNNINIINDPDPVTNLIDHDPEGESVSVYQVSNATLTIAGQNVDLRPSTQFSNDSSVAGEYDFTFQGRSGTIVEYKNGNVEIYSQDNDLFPGVEVGQQVVFKSDYSIINQDGIISTTTAPFTLTLDGVNGPVAVADNYEFNQDQLSSGTYKVSPTILNNDYDASPNINSNSLLVDHVFDGTTYEGYTPAAPTFVLHTLNQTDQTLTLTHVTNPMVDPNAIAEYTGYVPLQIQPEGSTGESRAITFDITKDGQVEVTREGINTLSPEQSLTFEASYNTTDGIASSSPALITVNIDGPSLVPPTVDANSYTFDANAIAPAAGSTTTNFNGLNIITDNDATAGTDSDPQGQSLTVNQITNFAVTYPDGTSHAVSGTFNAGDSINVANVGTFVVSASGGVTLEEANANESTILEVGQQVKVDFDYTNQDQSGLVSATPAHVSIVINGDSVPTAFPDIILEDASQLTDASTPLINILKNDQDPRDPSGASLQVLHVFQAGEDTNDPNVALGPVLTINGIDYPLTVTPATGSDVPTHFTTVYDGTTLSFDLDQNGNLSVTDGGTAFEHVTQSSPVSLKFYYTITDGVDQTTDPTLVDVTFTNNYTPAIINSPPVVEEPRYAASESLGGAASVPYDDYYQNFNTNSYPISKETQNISTITDPNTGKPQDISKYLVNNISLENNSSDLTVTFQSEGAGYKNTIGWYQIDPKDGTISNVKLIWDNASAQGSGGNLIPGQTTADLGQVTQGEKIGFFLIADGYDKNANIDQIMSDINKGYGHLVFTTTESATGPVATISSTAPYLFYVPTDTSNASVKTSVELISATGDHAGIYHTAAGPDNNFALNGDGLQHSIGSLIADSTTDPTTGQKTYSTDSAAVQIGFEDLAGPYGNKNTSGYVADRDLNDDVFTVNLPIGATNYQQEASNHVNANFTDADGTQLTKAVVQLSASTGGLNGDTFTLPDFAVSSTADADGYHQITTAGYNTLSIKGLGASLSSSNAQVEIDIKGTDTHAHYQDIINDLHLDNILTATDPNAAAGTREISVQVYDEDNLGSNIDSIPYIITNLTAVNTIDARGLTGDQYIDITDPTITGQTIYGNNGDDIFQITTANNTIYTGDGNDQIISTAGGSTIHVGAGNDTIYTSGGGNTIYAGSGSDYIDAGTGTNDIYIGSGQSIIAFQTADTNGGSMNTIHNLITAGNSNPTIIDLSQILHNLAIYTPDSSDINQFVQIQESSSQNSATLEIDTTGQAHFTPLATLSGITTGSLINVFDGNYYQMIAAH